MLSQPVAAFCVSPDETAPEYVLPLIFGGGKVTSGRCPFASAQQFTFPSLGCNCSLEYVNKAARALGFQSSPNLPRVGPTENLTAIFCAGVSFYKSGAELESRLQFVPTR